MNIELTTNPELTTRAELKNIEPKFDDFNKNPDLYTWANTNQTKPITNDIVINFFRQIFYLLEENNTCFVGGTFVFENYGNVLFNLITYNKLLIDNYSYECNNPLAIIQNKTPNVYVIGTDTHKYVYSNNKRPNKLSKVEWRKCMPKTKKPIYGVWPSRSNTKFERVFNPKIENICGYCKSKTSEQIAPTKQKGVLMYYPFIAISGVVPQEFKKAPNETETTVEMLFVKFEGFSVSEEATEHGMAFASRHTGIGNELTPQWSERREDDSRSGYSNFIEIDKKIYEKYCPEDLKMLRWYNENLRTGREFFVSRGLLTKFLQSFLFSNWDCGELPIQKVDDQDEFIKNIIAKDKATDNSNANQNIGFFSNLFNRMTLKAGKKRKSNKKTKRNKKTRKSRKYY